MSDVTTDPADAAATLRPVTADTICEGVGSDRGVDELRGAMVDQIIARHELLGLVLPGEVEAALRTVPRHVFAPGSRWSRRMPMTPWSPRRTSAVLTSVRSRHRRSSP
ncbi:MAG: hypothetical protein ACT4NY_27420 [Pseudonocardiales bacterium]